MSPINRNIIMMISPRSHHIILFLFTLSLSLFLPIQVMSNTHSKPPAYELFITFEMKKERLNGTAHVTLAAGDDLTLDLTGLDVSSIMLNRDNTHALAVKVPEGPHLYLPPSSHGQDIFISYTKKFNHSYSNIISQKGITLTSGWHPLPDRQVLFQLKCRVPQGFTPVTESDHFPAKSTANQFSFSFSKPLTNIHFAAAPYGVNKLKVRDNLYVYSLFFKEDENLSHEYLEKAAGYINRYEKEIGPFPYNHYVIVENRLPVGYGMDTFTLLGQMVIRLPFIKDTSLGHEVLHSWFGNSIEADYDSGNWCEGLTTYLADQAFMREKGEGSTNRKDTLINDHNYVRDEMAITLKSFQSASHNQPMAKSIRAVGYGRAAMLFHELNKMLGEKQFGEGLQKFYRDFKGKQGSWQDIQRSFEAISSKNLERFFQERLTRVERTGINVKDVSLAIVDNNFSLTFQVVQTTKTPYSIQLPIVVRTVSGDVRFTKPVSDKETTISLALQDNPLELIIDPDYDLMRTLNNAEIPPVLSRFFGSSKKLIVLESEKARDRFGSLIKRLQDKSWELTTSDKVNNADLANNSVLFLGINGEASRALFARPSHPASGFTLDVRTNPLNTDHVAILISASSDDEVKAVSRKLSHYGKYSYLHFTRGQIKDKKIGASQSGLRIMIDQLPVGGATSAVQDFDRIIDQLKDKRVVYVGEAHTSLADHILQFRIIEALHKKNVKLAIGMEMFPHSSQKALDDYISGDSGMDEKEFLKQSRYFEVWRYDFRLFRSIFNFAIKHKIPIIALNLERQIVSNIFKKGSTDELTDEQKKAIPVDRNLDMEGYASRLKEVHKMHMTSPHGGAFSGFIQSQALWDETMAETISNYLQDHPQTLMVVLAGSQHTRKDSGIPPRVSRRIDVEQASVINLFSNLDTELAKQADYFFLAGSGQLSSTAKIGIVLNPIKEQETDYLQISKISPHGNAGKAGILENDILLAIDDYPIHTMEDVRIAMIDAAPEQIMKIKVKRGEDEDQPKKLEFKVKLYKPSMQKPHP